MDLSNEIKSKVLAEHESQYAEAIYNHVVNKTVGEMTGDQKMIDRANAELVRLQKCRDALARIKSDLGKPD